MISCVFDDLQGRCKVHCYFCLTYLWQLRLLVAGVTARQRISGQCKHGVLELYHTSTYHLDLFKPYILSLDTFKPYILTKMSNDELFLVSHINKGLNNETVFCTYNYFSIHVKVLGLTNEWWTLLNCFTIT